MASARVGDPALRPSDDTLHIPTSFEIDHELRDWEGNALVTWAMRVPPSTTARHIEDAILEEFRLRPGEVSVTRHRPEAFLLRFQHRRHCEDVNAKGNINFRGNEVCVRPWQSLTGALGAALFYRVRICLDGVPRHAWLPDIVERLVGRHCALQCIDTNLLHPSDTRGIELWAWMSDPSRIAKVMWLVFTTRSMDGSSSSVQINEVPPERWQRGIKHRVLVHLWEIHDYSAVTTDPHDPDVAVGEPEKRRLPWYWGVVTHPPPPRRDECRGHDRWGDGRRERPDDHPDFHDWHGRRDDDDEDYDDWHGERRGHADPRPSRGAAHGGQRRVRSRSPRRRHAGHGNQGGRRRNLDGDASLAADTRKEADFKLLYDLQVGSMAEAAQKMFNLQRRHPPAATPRPLMDIFRKASSIVDATGDEAWFDYSDNIDNHSKVPVHNVQSLVPLQKVFHRITSALPPPSIPSIQEVDDELRRMTMRLEVASHGTPGQAVGALSGDSGRVAQAPAGGGEAVQRPPGSHDNDHTTDERPVLPAPEHQAASAFGVLFTRPEPPLHSAPTPRQEPAPLAQPESSKRRRPRRVFDMSTVRRNARLSTRRPMPAMQCAQHNLCRKLGLLNDDLQPVEAALQEYLAMFQGPLPPEVIAALTAAFNLEDEQAEALDAAMAMVAGEAIQDIQEAVEALQVEGPLVAA
uniref:DUF4283 domain-containing protein n=1 Tax=Setaria viridis TaxID=4556 RepID=A0A4U6T8I8_SETVI|nr:hypothetical protein SEVIR_9G542400v2 [Setaria viridis]